MISVGITGCSGYIGSRLVDLMESSSGIDRILGIDIADPKKKSTKLLFRRLDVRDQSLSRIFAEHGVSHVVHLAFVVNPMRDQRTMHDININGTRNVLKASLSCGARHITVASSTSAFGAFPGSRRIFTEADVPRRQPYFAYASDKYEIEMMLELFKRENPQLRVGVVRPCIVFGPHVDNYLSSFLLDLPFIPGVGGERPKMQFVHEDDAAGVLMRVVEKEADGCFHAVGDGFVETQEIAAMSRKRIIDFPPGLLYKAVDALWKLRFPLIKGPSGMLDFIRYEWLASDDLTRAELDLPEHMSSRDVIRTLLDSRGIPQGKS